MKNRIISGVGLISFLVILVAFSHVPYVLNLCAAVLSAMAIYEVMIATKYVESKSLIFISMAFAFVIPFASEISQILGRIGIVFKLDNIMFTLLLLYATILFFTLLVSNGTFRLDHLSLVFFMSVIIPCFFTTIVFANRLVGSRWNLILIILGTWIIDAGALFIGLLFGRHPLAPKISPKKTVEGAIGGAICGVVGFIAIGYVADIFDPGLEVNYFVLAVYALISSFFGMFGDLAESLIKRYFGVKDFSNLIPGHGGIMDRFDSVMFVSSFMYIAMNFYPIFTEVVN